MSVSGMIKKVYHWLDHQNTGDRYNNIHNQLLFLHRQNKPITDIDRGFLQYKCQMFTMNTFQKVFSQISSLVLFLPYIILLLFNNFCVKTDSKVYDAVFIQNGMGLEIIPQQLKNKYKRIKICSFTDKGALGIKEIKLLIRIIVMHPLSPYFCIKVVMKLALYHSLISQYSPKAIITYCETSFASAICTDYCEYIGIIHINVQHGDFLKTIRFCGFRFNYFYIWDEYYRRLFLELGNTSTNYIIGVPTSIKHACNQDVSVVDPKYYLTYYLGNESKDSLIRINRQLMILEKRGLKTKVRLHPRESDVNMIKHIFKRIKIEIPNDVKLCDSIDNSRYICALNSTVLYQGFFCGKEIVIDDKSNVNSFNDLKEKGYILLSKPHKLLSEIVKG